MSCPSLYNCRLTMWPTATPHAFVARRRWIHSQIPRSKVPHKEAISPCRPRSPPDFPRSYALPFSYISLDHDLFHAVHLVYLEHNVSAMLPKTKLVVLLSTFICASDSWLDITEPLLPNHYLLFWIDSCLSGVYPIQPKYPHRLQQTKGLKKLQ